MTHLYNIPNQQKISKYLRHSSMLTSLRKSEDDEDVEIKDLDTVSTASFPYGNSSLLSESIEKYLLSQQIGNLHSAPAENENSPIYEKFPYYSFKHAGQSYSKIINLTDTNLNKSKYDLEDQVDIRSAITTKIKKEELIINESAQMDVFDDDDIIHDTS